MQNWKTTASAVISAIASFVAMNPDMFEDGDKSIYVRVAKFVVVGGLVAFGITAKDK